MKKKVLGIFCHPDDEVLFGWPIFQSDEFEKHLIICCSDFSRKGSRRENALKKVCERENISFYCCLDEDNNFYALPTRRADYILTDAVKNINNILEQAIKEINPGYIFTHTPCGGYGHGSHRLLFQLVSQNEKVKNLLVTDINQISNHWSYEKIPQFIKEIFYRKVFKQNCNLSIDFYNRCKQIYVGYNAWTWSKEPIKHCNLYILKD